MSEEQAVQEASPVVETAAEGLSEQERNQIVDAALKEAAAIKNSKEELQRLQSVNEPKPVTSNFHERLSAFEQKKKAKLETLAEQQAARETQGCTFKPELERTVEKRSLQKFLHDQERYERLKQSKLEDQRLMLQSKKEEEEAMFASHQPSLCRRSILISQSASKHGRSVHEKYYDSSRLSSSFSCMERDPFVPQVNRYSREIVREEPVEQLLYKDALRRFSKSPPPAPSTEFVASAGSQRVLIEKLAKEIDEQFGALDTAEEGELNYLLFAAFMENTRFVKDEESSATTEKSLLLEAWNLVSENEVVTKENLIIFLLCLMNLFPGTNEDDQASLNTSSMGSLVEGSFQVTPVEVKRIHMHFRLLYENRVYWPKDPKPYEDFTYAPQILPTSELLAEHVDYKRQAQYGPDISRFDYYVAEKKRTREELEKAKTQRELAALEECSFRPTINEGYTGGLKAEFYKEGTLAQEWKKMTTSGKIKSRNLALYELANTKKQQLNSPVQTSEETKLQMSLSECTFKPKVLNSRLGTASSKKTLVNNAVERLSKPKQTVLLKKEKVAKPTSRTSYARRNYDLPDYVSPRALARNIKRGLVKPKPQRDQDVHILNIGNQSNRSNSPIFDSSPIQYVSEQPAEESKESESQGITQPLTEDKPESSVPSDHPVDPVGSPVQEPPSQPSAQPEEGKDEESKTVESEVKIEDHTGAPNTSNLVGPAKEEVLEPKAEETPIQQTEEPKLSQLPDNEVQPEVSDQASKPEIETEETKQEELPPDVNKQEEQGPEEIKLEEDQPEDIKPEENQPAQLKPEESHTEEPKPEEIKSEEVQPEEGQSEPIKPEEPKPEEIKSEEVQPEEGQSEPIKPEESNPEEIKPEEVKQEEVKQDEVKPEETLDQTEPVVQDSNPEDATANTPEEGKAEEPQPPTEEPKVEESTIEEPQTEESKPEVSEDKKEDTSEQIADKVQSDDTAQEPQEEAKEEGGSLEGQKTSEESKDIIVTEQLAQDPTEPTSHEEAKEEVADCTVKVPEQADSLDAGPGEQETLATNEATPRADDQQLAESTAEA